MERAAVGIVAGEQNRWTPHSSLFFKTFKAALDISQSEHARGNGFFTADSTGPSIVMNQKKTNKLYRNQNMLLYLLPGNHGQLQATHSRVPTEEGNIRENHPSRAQLGRWTRSSIDYLALMSAYSVSLSPNCGFVRLGWKPELKLAALQVACTPRV